MTKTIPLVDYLSLGDRSFLSAQECKTCRARFFDRRNACASCSGQEFITVEIPQVGEVVAFSIVFVAAPDVKVPFVPAIINCGGTSVRGNIVNVSPDPENISVGMKVRLTTFVVGSDDEGTSAIGYGFEPIEV
ncbi:MAG: hypothetical protein JW395_3388 [Nitrospira sp.]|nr:hypothetical protein [Nitrospira sp.]